MEDVAFGTHLALGFMVGVFAVIAMMAVLAAVSHRCTRADDPAKGGPAPGSPADLKGLIA